MNSEHVIRHDVTQIMVQTASYNHIQEVPLQNAPQASLPRAVQKIESPERPGNLGRARESGGGGSWRRVGD